MQMENVELKDFSYLIVIAQIKDGPIIEYVAYDPKYEFDKDKIDDNTKPVDNDDDDDDDDPVVVKTDGYFIKSLNILVIFGFLLF